MREEIETARLRLRRPEAEDEASYLALFRQPAVEAWLRPEPLRPFVEAELLEMLREDIEHWRRNGFGPWALLDKRSGEFAGRVGLRWTAVGGAAAVELAWTVDPARQSRGLASEAAAAALVLARAERIEEIVALVLPANAASRRVAVKIGLEEAGAVEHAGLPHLVYRSRLG
jgi:RimJ/RimL family protein N-acetyltransferase